MADELKNSKTISKKDAGFPDYLDFARLRSEGIEYLGKLAGQLWTDHNVHDPGITILEVLCYALLDLGYRTNLPEADILARPPEDTDSDTNFFTPARILACNPLTITDYRKLLIDIQGVRNAWLEPTEDVIDVCQTNRDPNGGSLASDAECVDFLNGLYHVYIDLEKDPDDYVGTDEERKEILDKVIDTVKEALMAHRNLCEDFEDISILCKLSVGVCADIALEEEASAETVYLAVVEALQEFFAPAPRFYTLPQLLDKQKPIEDIFAGRPYDITQSHGFVDTEEFEKIQLRKEIHLSDVYHVILGVPGVQVVRNLHLRTCDDSRPAQGWKFHIPKNHIPRFSPQCSGFRFSRNDQPLSLDTKKYEGILALTAGNNGKILYRAPSPYLDQAIPQGSYRSELSDYYSIQREFPRVYGIEEGGLPQDASPQRKAQALQLKGYLLFFDQLLANYLTQLSHIRSLFALSSPEDEVQQRTYFINQLDSVPELQKLLRFPASEAAIDTGLGTQGSILAFPVDKNELLAKQENDQLKHLDLEQIKPYTFSSRAGQDTEISQLKNDLDHEAFQCEFVTKTNDCIFYYLLFSSSNVALISKKYFGDIGQAEEHATSIKYIGLFDENYRSFSDAQRFSFTLELNLDSFAKYLQRTVEDRDLYRQRRQGFLRHLLARFAERFTDYALLSFGNLSNDQTDEANIRATERFLTHYDDISSNRGKAYDYRLNGWSNDNISGFEKRVKALTGMENWQRHTLCNFVVEPYEQRYKLNFQLVRQTFFSVREAYDSPEEARQAAQILFTTLSDRTRYQTQYIPHEQAYAVTLRQNDSIYATHTALYATSEEADKAAVQLHRLFSGNPAAEEDIIISQHIYFLQLQNQQGEVIRTSAKSYDTKARVQSVVSQLSTGVNNEKRWNPEEDADLLPGTLHRDPQATQPQFIDLGAFKLDISDTIVGRPNAFTYGLLDHDNRFKIKPISEFDDRKQARQHWLRLLGRMPHPKNYRIQPSPDTGFSLHVILDDGDEAVCDATFSSEAEAGQAQEEMLRIVRQHCYRLAVQEVPYRWKFRYHLGKEASESFSFESVDEYLSPEEARTAVAKFSGVTANLQLRKYQDGLRLVPVKTAKNISSVQLQQEGERRDIAQLREPINQRLALQQEVNRLRENFGPEAFAESVGVAIKHDCEEPYVYRLVDTDTVPAQYSISFKDANEAEEKKKGLARIPNEDYPYLEICQGGDIIRRRKNEDTGAYRYHYQIKSRQPVSGLPPMPVLLESTRGYAEEEEARRAFTENYLQLLESASDTANYGNRISTEEQWVHTSVTGTRSESRAFVPQETLQALGDTEADAIQALVAIARSYPVRSVTFPSEAFNTLFPCEAVPEPEGKDCLEVAPKKVYYFRLMVPAEDDTEPHWQSTQTYATPEEAYRAFDFFQILLCYRGNFFVNCDRCTPEADHYRIYLREVLAESTRVFCGEAAAWEGVEHFISVSQSRRAFHNYQRKEDCCYSFYLACADSPVYHPCTYDNPRQRDDRMNRLYEEAKKYPDQAYTFYRREPGDYVLLDGQENPFARVAILRKDYDDAYEVDDIDNVYEQDTCDLLLRFLEEVKQGKSYKPNEEGKIQTSYDGYTLQVRPCQKEEGEIDDPEQWVSTLEAFAYYLPVVKENDKNQSYCLEIKLPGFMVFAEKDDETPCGCGEGAKVVPPPCYVAWKSRCSFASCGEAFEALPSVMRLLRYYENYRPLFNCDCYEFGIALHYGPGAEYVEPEQYFSLNQGEMIARNPQCYSTPDMVCAAVERTWKLINSEGLHVVEHILLRPRCEEDCQCDLPSERCDNPTDGCAWTWSEPNEDPCAERPDVCFVPGADPYSFIATVALPAWPVRFRRPESRQQLENILYREAPAHVLLRILWLSPHDFCCFEQHYQRWGRWLARKKNCRDSFSYCDFLEFLFHRNFKCPDHDDPCSSPSENRPPDDLCFASDSEEEERFQDQLHQLYCWRAQDRDAYQFTSCYPELVIERENDNVPVLATPTGETAVAPPAQPIAKPQLVNRRLTRYRSGAEQVLQERPSHPLAMKVQAFLNDPQPVETRTVKLLSELAQNEPSEGSALSQQQLLSLLQSSVGYYLDKICFNGKDLKKIEALGGTFKELSQAGIDPYAVYRFWNPEEVQQYEPGVDVALIKAVITGTN